MWLSQMAHSGCPEHGRLLGHVKPPCAYTLLQCGDTALHEMEGPLVAFSGSLTALGCHHVFWWGGIMFSAWWKKGHSLLHGATEAVCL